MLGVQYSVRMALKRPWRSLTSRYWAIDEQMVSCCCYLKQMTSFSEFFKAAKFDLLTLQHNFLLVLYFVIIMYSMYVVLLCYS